MAEIVLGIGCSHGPMLSTPHEAFAGPVERDRARVRSWSWIAAAGALEHRRMYTVDYVPCYRSEAGTGVGMAFAVWE